MKSYPSYAVALAILLSHTSASPIERGNSTARIPPSVKVTLRGATPEAAYNLDVPLDAASTSTAPYDSQHLSISYVDYDHQVAQCRFVGVDVPAVVESDGQLDPPQTITSVSCNRAS